MILPPGRIQGNEFAFLVHVTPEVPPVRTHFSACHRVSGTLGFSHTKTSEELAKAADYPEVAQMAIKEMHRQVGDLVVDEHGLVLHDLLVRHLVMPGGLDESRQIFRFLAREVSPNTFVNVMPQYRPAGLASRYPSIARSLTLSEFQEAVMIAREEGLRRLARG